MIDFFSAYEEKSRNFTIFPRSYAIKQTKIILYGAPKSGKTSLALDLARHCNCPIFIDCADPRFLLDSTQKTLLELFVEKRFDMLIIDNYTPTLQLPNYPKTIITSPTPMRIPESIRNNFSTQLISPLNFEEYVSFSKSARLETIFANFLKEGNLPEILFLPEFKRLIRRQEIITLRFKEDVSIIAFLLTYQAKTFSVYNAFCHLKQYQKISKDRIYAFIQTMIDEGFLFLLPHANRKETKKLYFYDFSLPYALLPLPDFGAIFENLIFCELIRRNLPISYDDTCNFILDSLAIFATPFPNPVLVESKLSALSHPYDNVLFISIETTKPPTKHKNGTYSIISFIDFALEYINTLTEHYN